MGAQSEIVGKVMGWLDQAWGIALGWLTSAAALSQFALLVVAYLGARAAAQRLAPVITRVLMPPEGKAGMIATARRFVLIFLPLLLPLLAYGFTAIGEQVTRPSFCRPSSLLVLSQLKKSVVNFLFSGLLYDWK